ncbi:MAG: hypothetical protein JWP03_4146 [Phycisphaerales bacterium]|jgi:hypothetical protein|nr:hypothetical protein [Phycisphaerales bacterium]
MKAQRDIRPLTPTRSLETSASSVERFERAGIMRSFAPISPARSGSQSRKHHGKSVNYTRIASALVAIAWAAAVAFGTSRLWTYESTPGSPARPPIAWPADSHVVPQSGLPTLVLFAHPHCPCSRATVGELAKLMTDCRGKLTATVLVLRPQGVKEGWERTDLWNSAAAIPGVSVVSDAAGTESRRFGAVTSGQVLLFAADGRLLFSGGITESRGHSGDNAGRSAVAALVLGTGRAAQPASAPVYGCPLFNTSSSCPTEGTPACHKN